jgi:hypothetical protein
MERALEIPFKVVCDPSDLARRFKSLEAEDLVTSVAFIQSVRPKAR